MDNHQHQPPPQFPHNPPHPVHPPHYHPHYPYPQQYQPPQPPAPRKTGMSTGRILALSLAVFLCLLGGPFIVPAMLIFLFVGMKAIAG